MTYILADRIADTTTTTGTGTITVSGTAPSTYRTLSAALAVNDKFPYIIAHQTLNEWEVGFATYSAANQFTRDTIKSSSNSNNVVTFSAGTKDVFLDNNAASISRIDGSGRVTLGTTTVDNFTDTLLEAHRSASSNLGGLFEWNAGTGGPDLNLLHSRSNTIGTQAIVSNADEIGSVTFQGNDGATFRVGAAITGWVDATPSSNSMPGRLAFYTTPSTTGGSVTERLRIDSAGRVVIGGVAAQAFGSDTPQVQNHGTTTSTAVMATARWSADGSSARLYLAKSRGGSIGTHTALNSTDAMGNIFYEGSDGVTFQQAAAIQGTADAAFSSGSAPGRLQFFTTPSASTALTERMRIDKDGNVVVGGVAVQTASNADVPTFQLHQGRTQFWLADWVNDTNPCNLYISKSRNATIGSHTTVNSGDRLCYFAMSGSDGTRFVDACSITATVDGTPSSNSMPGQLLFATTASGAAGTTERMRIDSSGRVVIGGSAAQTIQEADALQLLGTSDATTFMQVARYSNDSSGCGLRIAKSRGASIGTLTALQDGDFVARFCGQITDGISWFIGGEIRIISDGGSSSGSTPGAIAFRTTSSGSNTTVERMRIDRTGAVFFPSVGTSASTANTFMSSGSSPVNQIFRGAASSIRYKQDITPIPQSRLEAAARLRPVEFTSVASGDVGCSTRFVGYVAEDVAADDRDVVYFDAIGRPDGLMYDRILLMKVEVLEQRIAQLERQLQTRH
jgi:hypothetical protein